MKITAAVTGILVTLIFNNVQCTLITKPSHAAAKIGDFVIMRCSSSSYANEPCGGIQWKYFQVKSNSGTTINIKDNLEPSFASHISIINSSSGNCDLKINATELTGGRYLCEDSTPKEADAELITLDPKVSEQSRDNMATVLECSVRYYGNWTPTVQWMKTSGDSWEIVASNDSEISKNPVSSTITIGTTEQFKCRVRVFEPGKPNTFIFDWMSRPYSLKNCTYPCSRDPEQIDGARKKGIGIGFAICLAIFCLLGVVAFIIFKRRRRIKEKGRNPPAEDL